MREDKHITKREEVPIVQRRTKSVDKKVIQPIHLDVQLDFQNGFKPTIFKGKEVHQAIDQGTQNLPTTSEKLNMKKK